VQHFEIVMVLVRLEDVYFLQLRTGANQSGALGKIGTFGGEIESGESAIDAACRELAEESTLVVDQSRLKFVGELSVNSEKYGKPATVHAMVYEVVITNEHDIEAREGGLVRLSLEELREQQSRLSPALKELVNILEKEK
jgi:8-oxo-dGTP pyrophosphatase MutT (NUDIX family)